MRAQAIRRCGGDALARTGEWPRTWTPPIFALEYSGLSHSVIPVPVSLETGIVLVERSSFVGASP